MIFHLNSNVPHTAVAYSKQDCQTIRGGDLIVIGNQIVIQQDIRWSLPRNIQTPKSQMWRQSKG